MKPDTGNRSENGFPRLPAKPPLPPPARPLCSRPRRADPVRRHHRETSTFCLPIPCPAAAPAAPFPSPPKFTFPARGGGTPLPTVKSLRNPFSSRLCWNCRARSALRPPRTPNHVHLLYVSFAPPPPEAVTSVRQSRWLLGLCGTGLSPVSGAVGGLHS